MVIPIAWRSDVVSGHRCTNQQERFFIYILRLFRPAAVRLHLKAFILRPLKEIQLCAIFTTVRPRRPFTYLNVANACTLDGVFVVLLLHPMSHVFCLNKGRKLSPSRDAKKARI
jgi:hypothetical protein